MFMESTTVLLVMDVATRVFAHMMSSTGFNTVAIGFESCWLAHFFVLRDLFKMTQLSKNLSGSISLRRNWVPAFGQLIHGDVKKILLGKTWCYQAHAVCD